ncbi:hypothetical protein ACVIQT_008025 [Bradyrhizobium diazoefficiens]
MDAKTFKADIEKEVIASPIDITLVSKWFEATLSSLKALHSQKAGISHPRHRGDARESDFLKAIEPIFPSSIKLSKGFALHKTTAHSREQDILLLDAATGSAILQTEGCSYYPVEAVLGSIEVKSRLTLTELRKAIINCISVKKLSLENGETDTPPCNMWHSIFAYESVWNLKEAAKHLNQAVTDVPVNLRPDAVYIVGKGLLIPGSAKGLALKYRQDINEGYQALPDLRTELLPASEAHVFLWFATAMVDHCLQERVSRKPLSLFSYMITPLLFQLTFEQAMKEKDPASFQKWIDARRAED